MIVNLRAVTDLPFAGLGVALPCVDAFGTGTPIVAQARAAEAAGLDHVWVPDHLIFGRPILETTVALSVVAGATEHIKLGTAILNGITRPVTWLAKQLATLMVLAPDRLLLGTGLGGEFEAEFRAAGITTDKRGKRLDEALDVLALLLAGEAVHQEGLQTVDCDGLAPVPGHMPPVLVGGRSEAALKRAARVGQAWMPMWMDPATVAEHKQQLTELAAAQGRPEPGVLLVAFVTVTDDPEEGRRHAATLTEGQYGMPFAKVERWTPIGPPAAIAERLQEYRDAGVDGFSLATAHPDPLTQVDGLAEVRGLLGW